MKSNGGQKSNNTLGSRNSRKIKRMRLRSNKQQGQNDMKRKMAGNNSTQSVKIIKTKSLQRNRNQQKNISIQPKIEQPQESQTKDKQKQSQDTKVNEKSKRNKQTTKQKRQSSKDKEQERIDTQMEDQINQKLKFYNAKFTVLTEIGIPTINLHYDRIKQFIKQYQNEIKLNDESVISKLIGAIGEAYVESDNEVTLNVESKKVMIQKQITEYLEDCGIKLDWTQERWDKIIQSTLFEIPYFYMPNVNMRRDLEGKEKYQIILETLNLFTQINKWSKMQMQCRFCQNFPLQTKESIDIRELVDENELHNVRLIREYLSRIMNALNKIQQLQVQRQTRDELHLTANQLQDLSVEYYLNKMKVLQLKPVILQYVTNQPTEKHTQKDEISQDLILDKSSIKQNDQNDQSQDGQVNMQDQLQQKKTIQIKVLKSKTLLEYFKPAKQLSQNDDNSQNGVESKEKDEKLMNQSSENKPQTQYFDILENFFQSKLGKQTKVQDQKK
ncbi:unnamed protein product (macronuclear) [Paramecium tetraurelia]|uniref:Chromosome undetermined scaffold_1, whole genome shotgun sequence n=1 Tax=Paramecium tetraurelia TaxID=5888 RepID=Q6BFB9_PARTE|nr:hypothetical protein [Paramecium tetraurelia strain d4-2]XP_001422977.1 uncharacterized protein GSPATT00000014001 [Paramecium tetraurelia]CAH03652.1 hypothetical protein PTMB.451 [Paramecium tetraurelia]CAK55579.1 unnamed protein product [Paramecium tetraurelia]|eukprot:XP_001422977.1 hypothetical protein (macronuclear) [Paramecium tetraurelia strain d4-2]